MSQSKLVMAKRLSHVQQALMGKEFGELSLQSLLPIIFTECFKENLTFWFSFIEDACVLNLRDTRFDNYELNIRQYIGSKEYSVDDVKLTVLCNAFLIVPGKNPVGNVTNLEEKAEPEEEPVKETKIRESNIVPPSAIRIAMEECEQNNEPVTRKNVESKLNLKAMSQDKRRQCIAFLRDMKE